jgi:hypothetical protein
VNPSPDQAEQFQKALLAVYRDAFTSSGFTYETLEQAIGISRAKLVRLVGPSPSGAAMDPRDAWLIANALGITVVEATRQATDRVLDQGIRPTTESD